MHASLPAAAPGGFRPEAIAALRLLDRDLDERRAIVRLGYALDDAVAFEETIRLPGALVQASHAPTAAVDGALDLLHLAAGVSYFKAADPPALDVGALRLTPALARVATLLYGEGLAEFRFRNGRPVRRTPRLPDPVPGPSAGRLGGGRGPLVPVGGGKDSVVTLDALARTGRDVQLFSVGDAPPIARTAAVSGLPRTVARRRISPALLELNRAGALNGHVPVTAIVSAVAVLVAVLGGRDAVVMSNERSAGQGSLRAGGVDVNHQFSKGPACERALRDAVRDGVAGDLECFSLLRPASELAIARAFARLTAYHGAFTSCNAAFRLDPARRAAGWCGACPKCRFVFLALAPFMGRAQLTGIFGRDLLDEPAQVAGFAELMGRAGPRPFECVGTEEESIAALRLLAAHPEWGGAPVVRALREQVLEGLAPGVGDPEAALRLGGEHLVPPAYRDALDAAFRP